MMNQGAAKAYDEGEYHFITSRWEDYIRKHGSGSSVAQLYGEFTASMKASPERIPTYLREAFELLVECHGKKVAQKYSFLNENQKRSIRQIIIFVCAIAGPPEGSGFPFLDFTKIKIPECHTDCMRLCINWFLKMMAEKTSKKDLDLVRRVKQAADEIEKMCWDTGFIDCALIEKKRGALFS